MSATTKCLCCTGRWVGWADIQDHIWFRKYHLQKLWLMKVIVWTFLVYVQDLEQIQQTL